MATTGLDEADSAALENMTQDELAELNEMVDLMDPEVCEKKKKLS